jgi:hypothetical protein
MKSIDLKKDIHLLIDKIENENLLEHFYALLLQSIEKKKDVLWDQLSKDEQEQVLLSFDESFNESNLISHQEARKKYAKWL